MYGDDPAPSTLAGLYRELGSFFELLPPPSSRRWRATAWWRRPAWPHREAASGSVHGGRLPSSSQEPLAPVGDPARAHAFWARWAQADVGEEHWHLGPVGVEPGFQGRGIGGRMMRAVCAWLDEGGRLAWLETDKERNVRFYGALGFEVASVETVLGVETWYMRRTPAGETRARAPRGRHLRAVPPLLGAPPGPAPRAARSARCGAWCSRCSRCCGPAPPTSVWPPTTSSNRSATTCGPGTRPARASPELLMAQFPLLEAALVALGVVVWPMVELEADDALASAAAVAADDDGVEQVLVCTPDKDLAQCVRGDAWSSSTGARTWSPTRRRCAPATASGPSRSPTGWRSSATAPTGSRACRAGGNSRRRTVLGRYGHLEAIPPSVSDWDPDLRRAVRSAPKLAERLASDMDLALLFRDLATLRVDRSLLASVQDLRWRAPPATSRTSPGSCATRPWPTAPRPVKVGG